MLYLAMTCDRQRAPPLTPEAYRRVLGFWPDQTEAKQAIARIEAETGH